MQTIRIIGVPEHFNLPWHLAIEEGAFSDRGIELVWTDIPEGTGKMAQMLQDDETDLAIILTEGIIKSISQGNPSKIVQEYVSSPLLWGIHISSTSERTSISELEHDPVAISRKGSGSHLMSIINAENQGWNTKNLQFDIVNNLEGAIAHLKGGSNAYFMWERFMTKPLVDAGIFKHLGDCPTPWSCFVIAATERFLSRNNYEMDKILDTINTYTLEFKQIPSIDRTLANRYEQKLEDIQEWLGETIWGQQQLTSSMVMEIQERLYGLNLVDNIRKSDYFLYNT